MSKDNSKKNTEIQISTETKNDDSPKVSKQNVSSVKDTPPPENLEFSRKNIEKLGSAVRLVDTQEEDKLDLFCYVRCTEQDSDLLKECRGVVFNGEKLIMKAFPYTTEYNHTDTEIPDISTKEFHFFESYEGALIRLFYFGKKWYISTHRKLDAFKSKWASQESFGDLFVKALQEEYKTNEKLKKSFEYKEDEESSILNLFLNTLNKDKKYMFLLRNNSDNRIVCKVPEKNFIFYVGGYGTDNILTFENDTFIPNPEELFFPEQYTREALINSVEQIDPQELQGIICFGPENQQFKIFNKKYQELFKVRGNEPSIKFRYLQVRMDRKSSNMLYKLYPDMEEVFEEYENSLYEISQEIYRSYVQRFIKKRYVTAPKEEFQVIRECHDWHLSNRTENRICLNQVIKVMNKQGATNLNHMIRRYKIEQHRKKDSQETMKPRSNSFNSSPTIKKIQTPQVSPFTLLPQNGDISNIPPLNKN